MLDCPPDYLECGSFSSQERTAHYEIRPTRTGDPRFRCRVWSDDGDLDKVATSTDYSGLWAAARELAWSWLLREP